MCIIMRWSRNLSASWVERFRTSSLLCTYKLCNYYSPIPILSPFLFTPSLYVAILNLQNFSFTCIYYNWRAGASQLNRTTGTNFLLYLYIYHRRCHTANRLRVSKLTQLTIFHTSSPRVYRHGDSSRRCTVATVQDEANPSSSQPIASCCVASESTEAHTDGWREHVLAEESVLPRKQPKRKRGVFLLSAARSTREAR